MLSPPYSFHFFYLLLPRLRWVIKLGLSVSWPIMYVWRAVKIDLHIPPTPLLLGSISLGGWLPLLLLVGPSRSLLVPIAFCYYLTTIYWLSLFPIPSCTSLYKSKGGIAAGETKKEISFVFSIRRSFHKQSVQVGVFASAGRDIINVIR